MHVRAFIRAVLPMIWFCVSPNIYSLGVHVQQKYPNVLLTEDYGIVNQRPKLTPFQRPKLTPLSRFI